LQSRPVRGQLESDEVRVRWLAAPVNPLDINKLEGNYPIKLPFPIIAGSEGVGRVEAVGKAIKDIRPGDHVIPHLGIFGVWCHRSIQQRDELIQVDKRIDLESASTLLINPPTAYVMLKDFVQLKPGDWVIQNSANSSVGRAVIQLARALGYRTVNLVRDRPDLPELVAELRQLGADHVFTEEQFRQWSTQGLKTCKPRLALNGVGGRSALIISSALDNGSTMVTYGGMSKRPTEISTGSLVFKDIRACGVAISEWMMRPEDQQKTTAMFNELQQIILAGQLKPSPMRRWPMNEYRSALQEHLAGKGKQLLILDNDTNGPVSTIRSKY